MSDYQNWSIEFPKQRFEGRAYGLYSAVCKKNDIDLHSMSDDIAEIQDEFNAWYNRLSSDSDSIENKIIRKLYNISVKHFTVNRYFLIRGFKEGYTAYKNCLCLDLLLKDMDLPLQIVPTNQDKLYFAEGNVFNVEGFGFDGIACFLPKGSGMIHLDFMRFMEKNPDDIVATIYDFHRQQEIPLSLIPYAVNTALDMLHLHKCRRMGFHGVRVYGVDDHTAEHYTIRAVSNWITKHFDEIDAIIMVDRGNSYYEHL